MKKVYLVVGYEMDITGEVLGVYSTYPAAKGKVARVGATEASDWDIVSIQVWELDGFLESETDFPLKPTAQ